MFLRGNAQTHVNKISVCKGSQWVLFVATDVDTDVYERPVVYTALRMSLSKDRLKGL